jgi:pimeloyl-ACP methyl ester carboxylesterase
MNRRAILRGAPVAGGVAWGLRHVTAPAVRSWRPGAGQHRRAGPLTVRTAGTGETAVVLLHGLPASGDSFGAGFDVLADDARLVVPDLLGFGRSMDAARGNFTLHAHLQALDAMAGELDLDGCRLVVGGHSMGGLLALHWTARHAERIDAVVTWSAPLFRDRSDAAHRLEAVAPGLARVALPGPVARTTCLQLCCRRQKLASWLYVALCPHLPVSLARRLVDHTWDSYAAAITEMVLNDRWHHSAAALERSGVPVLHAHGARDVLASGSAWEELAGRHRKVSLACHPSADHLLPLEDAPWCAGLLHQVMPAGRA